MKKLIVKRKEITILTEGKAHFFSLTDMLKAKDGDFFISDWLRNRNTIEFLGIWEAVNNPDFNYGEFAIIKSQSGLKNKKSILTMCYLRVKALWTKKEKDNTTYD